MTRVDLLHPEDLLDGARNGSLTVDQRRRLLEHLEACDVCAFEHALCEDFATPPPALPGDDAWLDALVERVVAESPSPKRTVTRWRAAVAAGALAVAAGAVVLARGSPTEVAPIAAEPPETPSAAPPAPARASRPPVDEAPPSEFEPDRKPAPRRPVLPAPPPPVEDAPSLFRDANAARRDGRVEDALRLYARLVDLHPASAEAHTALVTTGRLSLDRGDATSALRSFEAYLSASHAGPLGEEARAGRALALGALGRHADERAAWRELLVRHPMSAHRARAEQRLGELE